MAVSRLTPPEPLPVTEGDIAPATTYSTSRLGRIFSRRMLKATVPALCWFAFNMFVVFGLPKFSTRLVLDIFWGTLMFLCMWFILIGASATLFPPVNTIRFHQVKADGPFTRKESADVGKIRVALAALTSLAVIGSSYAGTRVLHPVIAASWIAAIIGFAGYPRFTMRHTVCVLNGYVLGVPLLIGILVPVIGFFVDYFSGDGTEVTDSASYPMATPSAWMASIMILFGKSIPTLVPGIIIGLGLRYDYSQTTSLALTSPNAPGEAVAIPLSTPAFAKPTFTAGLVSLGGAILALEGVTAYYPSLQLGEVEAAWAVATVPIVTVAMAVTAWKKGQLAEWWAYEERWLPKVDKAAKGEKVTDLEAAPATDSEKDGLLKAVEA